MPLGNHAPSAAAEEAPVSTHESLADLPADVQAFLAGYGGDELCLSRDWFDTLIRYGLPKAQRPRIYVVREPLTRAVDCVLFAMVTDPVHSPRTLQSLANFYTMSYGPLFRRDLADRKGALRRLARFIAGERPKWAVIDLKGFIKEEPATAEVLDAFRRAGFLASTYFQFENWCLPVKGVTAEEYFKSRPSQVRNTITRKGKKASKEHRVEFALYTSGSDIATGIGDYQRIYARSWKNPESFPEFIPQLLERFAASGNLRLGVLRIDGDPAAAQIWLVTGGRATIYKLAYDEQYAPMSVGSLLTKQMFDWVLTKDAVTVVDYGVGSEAYKRDWMSDCRHVIGLIFFNPWTLTGMAVAGRHIAGRVRDRIDLRRSRGRRLSDQSSLNAKEATR